MATSKITIEQYIGFEKKKETKAKVKADAIASAFCM